MLSAGRNFDVSNDESRFSPANAMGYVALAGDLDGGIEFGVRPVEGERKFPRAI